MIISDVLYRTLRLVRANLTNHRETSEVGPTVAHVALISSVCREDLEVSHDRTEIVFLFSHNYITIMADAFRHVKDERINSLYVSMSHNLSMIDSINQQNRNLFFYTILFCCVIRPIDGF